MTWRGASSSPNACGRLGCLTFSRSTRCRFHFFIRRGKKAFSLLLLSSLIIIQALFLLLSDIFGSSHHYNAEELRIGEGGGRGGVCESPVPPRPQIFSSVAGSVVKEAPEQMRKGFRSPGFNTLKIRVWGRCYAPLFRISSYVFFG